MHHRVGARIQAAVDQHVVQLLQRDQQQTHIDAGARAGVDVARFQSERVGADGDPALGGHGQVLAHRVAHLRRLRLPPPLARPRHGITRAPIHKRQGLAHIATHAVV